MLHAQLTLFLMCIQVYIQRVDRYDYMSTQAYMKDSDSLHNYA